MVKRHTGSVTAKRHDVAQLAGVSETTVSFVYSKKRYVSPDLVERVLKAAKELNYYPDMVAASMCRGRTNSIAVITEDLVSPLQMQVIKALQDAAIKAGYFVYVCGGTEKFDVYLNNIISRKVDGVFLAVTSAAINNDTLIDILDRDISVIVTSNRGFPDDRVCGLEVDFTDGMERIIGYLKSLGHEKIAYLSYCDDPGMDRRLPAFLKYAGGLSGCGGPLVETGSAPYDSGLLQGNILMNRLLDRTDDFTAVVCSNDIMACGAMLALRERGYSVPERMSVVGIDDIYLSRAFCPPLTTLSHCSEEYGKRIFEILLANINDKTCVKREIIKPELIVRQSTARCPTGF